MISYRSACRPVTAVPDVERLVERLQHGLQYDGHAGARLQEDQLLPDDPLRSDTAAGLREGVRGPESHLVSVHTHALRVWGLRALHVAGRQGAAGRKRDALPRAFVFAPGEEVHPPLDGIVGKESLFSARDRSRDPEAPGRFNERILEDREGARSLAPIENLLRETTVCNIETAKSARSSFRRSLPKGAIKKRIIGYGQKLQKTEITLGDKKSEKVGSTGGKTGKKIVEESTEVKGQHPAILFYTVIYISLVRHHKGGR